MIFFFRESSLFWLLFVTPCVPHKDFQQPLENESELMSCGFMFWSAEATVGRKIDLFCDGVFAVWFLIKNGSYKERLALWLWWAANLMFTLHVLCCRNVPVAVSPATSPCEVTRSSFNELFVRKCITLNNGKGRERQGRLPIIMTYLSFCVFNQLPFQDCGFNDALSV